MATYAVSGFYSRSEHMSPTGLGAAVLLHAAVAAALWWLSMHRPPTQIPPEEPIEVTIEKPKPPEAPPEPPKIQQQQALPPPAFDGLRPPAPIESDKPTQVPTPNRQPAEPAPPQTAKVIEPTPKTPAPPPPPKPEPPRPAPPPQANHGIVVPPANPLPRPSPLSRPQQQQQAATTQGPDQPAPSPFVNPADTYNRARVQDNYLWQVVSRLRGYKYHANVTVSQGITVVRIVIARDGRLLDAQVVSSSGQPEMDRGVLAGVRAGSPYTPLPDSIQGASATFTLPLVSVVDR